MFCNIFWMGLSSAVRLGTAIILFALIARHLGPEEFGHYMFWYSVTSLCALFASYGLSNMLLKEIAQHPENVTNFLGESLSLQLLLSVSILLCALGGSALVDRPELLLILLLAHLVEIISITFYTAYRAMGYYNRESQLATCVAIVQFIFVASTVITKQNTNIIALAHLTGKIAQLALIFPISKRIFGAFSLKPIYTAFKLVKRTKAYAIDNILGSVFGNIDSIVLRIFVGIDVIGIYQSGMRLFQGGAQIAPILANVFLPEMARQILYKKKKLHIAYILQGSFLTYGVIFGLILAYFPDQIVNLFFGESYKQLSTLLPLFGLLFSVRFFAAAWGVILTATGHQSYRAKLSAIELSFTLALGCFLVSSMHSKGWLITLILANLLRGIFYMIYVVRSNLGISLTLGVFALLGGFLLFLPIFL